VTLELELERGGKRLGLAVLAVVLVVSMAMSGYVPGEGPIQEAAAVHDCDNLDATLYGFSFGHVNKDKCTNNHVDDAVQEVRDAESSQTKADIYAALNGQKSKTETYKATYDNYLQDTESVAWMKAEKAIAEAHKNGQSKSQAKVAAKNAIADYYSVKQINLIESWNTTVTSYEYAHERSMQEGFNQADFGDGTWYPHQKEQHFIDHEGYLGGTANPFCYPNQIGTGTVTLANASTHTTRYLGMRSEAYDTPDGEALVNPAYASEGGSFQKGAATWNWTGNNRVYCWQGSGEDNAYTSELMVDAPNSNYDDSIYYSFGDNVLRWKAIETKNAELQSESEAFIDATWQDLEDGNINSTDIISRNTQMFEYGSAAQESSNYHDTIGATAAMGIETPQLEGTGTMTVTDGAGNTHEGMLFGDPPNGSWTVGTTYDPDNISSPVIMATTSGEEHELTRPFTVDGATDKEGNEQSSVETQRYNYQTSNTSELNEKYDRLLGLTGELQERSESVDSNSGGGGGGSSGGGLPPWLTATYFGIPLWAIAAVLLVALVLLGGDN
jgi:hypothetical protein